LILVAAVGRAAWFAYFAVERPMFLPSQESEEDGVPCTPYETAGSPQRDKRIRTLARSFGKR
jgi:hypothetical protein